MLASLTLGPGNTGLLPAQATGTIRGTVTGAESGEVLAGVQISIVGQPSLGAATNTQGRYILQRVPTGSQTVVFRWLGYRPVERIINVSAETVLDVALEAIPVSLADLTVSAASRDPERIVDAPAAVTLVEPQVLQSTAPTGQAPLALAQTPGVDLVQSGVNDFNINARGFNSSLNRRVLTLLDGRDLAIAFLGSQEWNTLPVAMDELRDMELVRGPGSALYGANAFAGVINMTTLSPRESPGGKFSISGGELGSVKADGRWAGVFGEGRFGVRFNAGWSSNDTWSRSRTLVDRTAMQQEYAEAVEGSDIAVPLMSSPEVRALNGQTCGGETSICAGLDRTPKGDPDPITALYGSGRFDYYLGNGGVFTVEGGASQVENETLVTGIGRVQIIKGFKPYARVAYNGNRLNAFAYWNRRESKEPQYSLASGAPLLEKSDIMHMEVQGNTGFMNGAGRAIAGASFRQYNVNTDGTLMRPEDDDRHDKVYSAYAQLEYRIGEKVRLVGAARYDEGDLFDGQFSPKLGIVFSPNANHSFRATVNRAFQTPNYSEFYLRAAAGAPVNFTALETGLRAHPQLGPALAGVPQGQLFTNSAAVPVWARGNAELDVEKTIGYEIGWKGSLSDKVYVSVDAYMNNIKDFVTDLLPGINPAFPLWTAPSQVPEQARAALEGAVQQQLAASPATALAAAGLTRTEDGNTAIVVSYGNEGEVDQKGVDVGIGFRLTDELRLDGSVSFFDFEVVSQRAGDQLLPNTPKKKGTVSLSYTGIVNGFDGSVTLRVVEEYDWAAGVFMGTVPSSSTINASAGYRLTPNFRVFAVGTNILDQQRYHLFGGSVIGRRVIGGVTATF
ncbi:MAG TPA: TonB-dependent receptor [Gemmatimonadales bacterium]|nr:TonB-dependent receptor [Gemmatimonadales bacterium]